MSDDEEEYVVEAIRNWRYNLEKRRKEFLIKWHGYPESQNSWEPESNLNCQQVMDEFVKSLSPKQDRFFFSDDPTKLTGFQRNAEFEKCLGVDGPHDSDTEESPEKPHKQNFYLLVKFKDCDFVEEIKVEEFLEFQEEECFKFFESRLLRGRVKRK